MLAQSHVKSNKAVSNIVVAVILIVIAILAVSILWIPTRNLIKKSPPELDCFNLLNSISIKKTCYLNENEIQVEINRGFDKENIKNLKIYFEGEEINIWEITGKKCSDVRLKNKEYGGYCNILMEGETYSYIFNVLGI